MFSAISDSCHGSRQERWSPGWPWSSEPGTPFTPVQCLKRQELLLGMSRLGICQDHDIQGTSHVLPGTQHHAESKAALRGCLVDAHNENFRIRAGTRSDCGFLCICVGQVALLVNQGNSSQRSCRLNAPQIQIFALCFWLGCPIWAHWKDGLRQLGFERHPIKNPLRNAEGLRHLFSQFRSLARHESTGCNLTSKALSDLTNQLEAGLLAHAFQLPLRVQRHGVSSSPMEPSSRPHPRSSPVHLAHFGPVQAEP